MLLWHVALLHWISVRGSDPRDRGDDPPFHHQAYHEGSGGSGKDIVWGLQMSAGLEAVIEGPTHAVVQRRCEQHAPEPGGEADDGSEGAEDDI